MNLLLATNSMKGCLSPTEISNIIKSCVETERPDINITTIPGIDGGEGFCRDLVEHLGGIVHEMTVSGPLGEPTDACFGIVEFDDKRVGIIESSSAIGLSKIPEEKRNPMLTSTYGIGELIMQCLNYHPDVIMVGCGDSSTNDAGVGMIQALGVKFCDSNGCDIPFGGGNLADITSIDTSSIDPRIASTEFIGICNLKSIMCGERGTTRIHATRKGASVSEMFELERGINNYVGIVNESLDVDISNIPGGGGSGGVGSALLVYLGAELKSNFCIMEELGIEDAVKLSDEVFIAEGTMDFSTFRGKVNQQIIDLACLYKTRVVAIVGVVDGDKDSFLQQGINTILDINAGLPEIDNIMSVAKARIERAVRDYLKLVPFQ